MTNKLTRFFALLMVSLALLSAPVISGDYNTPFAVTAEAASKKTPAISAKKKTVYYKSKVTLKINNYKGKVKWSTSNKKIATVNSKGEVTGVALGECTIKAKTSKKTYKCTVTVKDRNVSSSVGIKVNGGGYFVKGESTAKVTVKPKKYNAAKASISIKSASGTTVYKKTLTKLEKNKTYSFNWDGKNTKGKYVSTGTYSVKVKIGEKTSSSSLIKFYAKNDFAGGNGAKKNPFVVKSVTHLKKLVKYPKGYFKQANDIDFKYSSIPSLFTADAPFVGSYDGGKKYIKNISGTAALFDTVGEKGVIKNVRMKNCSVMGTYQAIMVNNNYGKISSSNVNGTVTSTVAGSDSFAKIGLMVYNNYGTISNCTTSGQVSAIATGSSTWGDKADAGGLAFYNASTGRIISCTSKANVSAASPGGHYQGASAGGITAINEGLINSCEANGAITADGLGDCDFSGGIAGENRSQILDSYYTGESTVNLAGMNNGVIV